MKNVTPEPQIAEQKAVVAQTAQRDPWLADVVRELDKPTRTDQLVSLLGSAGAVERFKTVALHTIVHDDGLHRVDPLSVVEAIREAAVLNLEVYGPLGESWILPYGSVARLSIGYRGLLKLIRRSDEVSFIDSQIVYMADTFDVEFGTSPKIVHRPLLFGERDKETGAYIEDRGSYRGAYAWAQLKGSPYPLIEWMPLADIEQVRKASPSVKAGRKSPWDDWYAEMARKSPLRRLAKRLPLDAVAERAVGYESESDELGQAAAPAPAPQRSSAATAVRALESSYPVRAAVRPEPVTHDRDGDERFVNEPLQDGALPADGSANPEDGPETNAGPTEPQAAAETATESKPEPKQAKATAPRPAAPVEDDDTDLADLVSSIELGGEG